MGGSEKVKKSADVIMGWSLTQRHPLQSKLFSTCVANDGSTFLRCFQLLYSLNNTKLHFKEIELAFRDFYLFIF